MGMTIYALKGDPGGAKNVASSLQQGIGRFGWSYMIDESGNPLTSADLRDIKRKIESQGWNSLTKHDLARYEPFLLDLTAGDWVVYVNIPKWGMCTLAQVNGGYFWDGSCEDFNHCFHVEPRSIRDFDRNHDIVRPALSARLKLQGRYWRIYAENEFSSLLSDLEAGVETRPRTSFTNASLLGREIEPLLRDITSLVQRTHPNYDFEGLLELVFKSIPEIRNVVRQGGPTDHGADLIIEFESGIPHPAFQTQHKCIVQAKSFVDEHWDTKAVEDARRAFARYPSADMAIIMSTAVSSTPALDEAIRELRTSSGKRVELLIGPDLARFILRFGQSVLG